MSIKIKLSLFVVISIILILSCCGPKYPSFHAALKHGYMPDIEYYIEHGVDVNAMLKTGKTPLSMIVLETATYPTKIKIVKYLIANGADVNAKNKEGVTPLHVASMFGQVKTAQLLLEKKADINASCDEGYTALHYAVSFCEGTIPHGYDRNIINLLLKHGADVNAKTKDGYTVLDKVLSFSPGCFKLVPLLKKHGAKANKNILIERALMIDGKIK